MLRRQGPGYIFSDELACFVRGLSYDFEARRGRLEMNEMSCTSMRGCIEFFKRIDPEVELIETIGGGDRKDTTYVREGDSWRAVAPR